MFYVSRRSLTSVYIYDDSDGTEEAVTLDDISYLTSIGVEIKGVEVSGGHVVTISPVPYSSDIKSLKYKMVCGVDYQVNADGELIYLSIDRKDAVLRLSDICSSIGAFSFRHIESGSKVIFDDKIRSISETAFDNLNSGMYKFDLFSLRDDLAHMVYEYCICVGLASMVPIRNCVKMIIDNNTRVNNFSIEIGIFEHCIGLLHSMSSGTDKYILSVRKDYMLNSLPKSVRIRNDKEFTIRSVNNMFQYWIKDFDLVEDIRLRVLNLDIFAVTKSGIFSVDIDAVRRIHCYLSSGGTDKDVVLKFYNFLLTCAEAVRNSVVLGIEKR